MSDQRAELPATGLNRQPCVRDGGDPLREAELAPLARSVLAEQARRWQLEN